MTGIEEAITALQAGAYDEAAQILDVIGAGRPGAASLRARALWAITQILRMHFTNETAEAILEVGRRTPNPVASIYQRMLSAVGPLETLLAPAAAQEVRLRVGGYFLRRGGSEEEAPPWLIAAREAEPEDPIAAYLEASSRFLLYRERRAVSDMEAVLEKAVAEKERAYLMSGRTEGFYYHLGEAHERMEHFEEAAAYYEQALEINPEDDIPRVALGGVLLQLGRLAEAVGHLAQVSKYAADYLASARLRARALFQMGQADDAIALLEELAELDPLGAVTFLELGRIYIARGELGLAEIVLARAFRTDPALPGLNSAIIRLERLLGRHLDPDAGLPAAAEFAIPDRFAPRLDDPALAERADFRTALNSFFRVVQALIVRDILALYAHSGVGYFWALAQPLIYLGAIGGVYLAAGHKAPLGTSVVAYLAAGIIPYISFYVRVETAVASAVRGNVALLYFRHVTPLALIAAAALREFLTSLMMFVLIAGAIAAYDKSVQLSGPLTMLAALTGISMLGVIVGVVFGLGELAIPSLQLAEMAFARVMLFFSGALYYANLLPPRMRELALFNPMFLLIEFVRNGFFGSCYQSRYANWYYPLEFIAVGLVFVVLILHSSRRYVGPQ
jgi:capsular polysaccharide transport system permease protein